MRCRSCAKKNRIAARFMATLHATAVRRRWVAWRTNAPVPAINQSAAASGSDQCEQAPALDADRRRDALNHNDGSFQIVLNIARWFTHCQCCATPRRQRRYHYAALTLLTVPFIAAGRAAIIDGTNAARSASRLDGATRRSTATENLGRCC